MRRSTALKAALALTAALSVAGGLDADRGLGSGRSAGTLARLASHNTDIYALKAFLVPEGVVPRPSAATPTHGRWTGRLVIVTRRPTAWLTWELWLLPLGVLSDGHASSAHVHFGREGVSGPIAITLCKPCKQGQHGLVAVPIAVARAITRSFDVSGQATTAYIDVHTARNSRGELRGSVEQMWWRGTVT